MVSKKVTMNYKDLVIEKIKMYKRLKKEDTDEGTVVYGVYNNYIRCAVKIVNIIQIAKKVDSELQNSIKKVSLAFLNEVRILSRLNHPNLVRIIDYGTADSDNIVRFKIEV